MRLQPQFGAGCTGMRRTPHFVETRIEQTRAFRIVFGQQAARVVEVVAANIMGIVGNRERLGNVLQACGRLVDEHAMPKFAQQYHHARAIADQRLGIVRQQVQAVVAVGEHETAQRIKSRFGIEADIRVIILEYVQRALRRGENRIQRSDVVGHAIEQGML